MEIIITPNERRVKRDMEEDELAYVKEVALPSESGTSVQGDQSAIPAGDYSSEYKVNEESEASK